MDWGFDMPGFWLSVLGTAAATLGAAIAYANSPWMLSNRASYDLDKLAAASLKRLDGSEQVVKAGELWRERGAVIMAVRRPG